VNLDAMAERMKGLMEAEGLHCAQRGQLVVRAGAKRRSS
jgi:hypothetical protein